MTCSLRSCWTSKNGMNDGGGEPARRFDGAFMGKKADWLLSHQQNVYSQAGEDGIIEQILRVLPVTDKWCVEFGAWDGLHLSNARNLIETAGYSAVLIEASAAKFAELQRNYASRKQVIPVNALVGF